MVVLMEVAPDFDRMFGALADQTRRDIVRRAISADEGIVELASHYPMSFAAVQKHIAILERAGLVTKERVGRRKVVRTNLERLRIVRRLLDQSEELSDGGRGHSPPRRHRVMSPARRDWALLSTRAGQQCDHRPSIRRWQWPCDSEVVLG